jgi:glycosyltransferase involved in cell wall biosynthesis
LQHQEGRPKRHCMVVHAHYPIGEPRVEREAQALIHRGFEVDVICLRLPGEAATEVVDRVHVYRLPVHRDKSRGFVRQLLEYLSFFILACFKLIRLHTRARYTTAEAHNLPDFLVLSALWPKWMGAKVILNIHDLMPEFYALKLGRSLKAGIVQPVLWEERLSCLFADHVIITTHRWREVLIQRGVPASKISVVMNLADPRIFKSPLSPRLHRGNHGFTAIYHGTITTRYGVDLAIRAANILRDRIPAFQLVLVGRGEYRDEAVQLVKELDLLDRVTFLDIKPLPELPSLLLQADVGVASYKFDGFTDGCLPTKLLEYTAMGIPAVVAPTPVITDYFDETMVEFCAPEDAADLAEHIYVLYSNPERYNELACNTAKFNQAYNWTAMSAEYVELINHLGGFPS